MRTAVDKCPNRDFPGIHLNYTNRSTKLQNVVLTHPCVYSTGIVSVKAVINYVRPCDVDISWAEIIEGKLEPESMKSDSLRWCGEHKRRG